MPTTELALPVARETAHIVVWEYQARPECQAEFLVAYGPDGDWAKLFCRSPEFLGVELCWSRGGNARFFTLDHWGSETGLDDFLAVHATAYDVLDRRFRSLTVWRRRIGGFPSES